MVGEIQILLKTIDSNRKNIRSIFPLVAVLTKRLSPLYSVRGLVQNFKSIALEFRYSLDIFARRI